MLARGGPDRRAVLQELRGLVSTDARRRRQRRNPVFVDPITHADAGETEVPQEVGV